VRAGGGAVAAGRVAAGRWGGPVRRRVAAGLASVAVVAVVAVVAAVLLLAAGRVP